MHELSVIGHAFVEFANKDMKEPMLDIGAAYGVATIPCLLKGAKVIANDICTAHLDELEQRAPKSARDRLTTITGKFPSDINFQENSISAILVSHVMTFLTEREIIDGINLFNRWLIPGGKLFLVNYTPYHRSLQKFIPIYERRKEKNKIFSGALEDKREFLNNECDRDDSLLSKNVPNRLVLLDVETISALLDQERFIIDYLDYLGGVESGVPRALCLDGREWVGCIATKV